MYVNNWVFFLSGKSLLSKPSIKDQQKVFSDFLECAMSKYDILSSGGITPSLTNCPPSHKEILAINLFFYNFVLANLLVYTLGTKHVQT